jgi:hypothetical protein
MYLIKQNGYGDGNGYGNNYGYGDGNGYGNNYGNGNCDGYGCGNYIGHGDDNRLDVTHLMYLAAVQPTCIY